MVVASGFKTHNSHRFASKVLVDLLVHSPSSVGAASNGTLCSESKGLLTNSATSANSMAQGVYLQRLQRPEEMQPLSVLFPGLATNSTQSWNSSSRRQWSTFPLGQKLKGVKS